MFKKISWVCLFFICLASEVSADEVLKKVYAESIYESDVVFAAKQEYGIAKFENLSKEQKETILKRLRDKLLVLDEAKKSTVPKSKVYEKELESAKKGILIKLFLEKKRKETQISDKELKAFYNAHLLDGYTKAKVNTIVNASEDKIKEFIKVLKKENPKTLKNKFEELAKKHSQHPSKSRGGALGLIGYGAIVQPFGKKAFSLKDNSITEEPFKTRLGYHIVYLEKKEVKPFSEVQNNIEIHLKSKKYNLELKSLREKYKSTH